MATKWYSIVNKADRAEIWIYDLIGEDFWTGGGVTAKNFQKELAEIKASQIDLHINSPGGLVFEGITIYNLLKNHPANVTTFIDGLAGSIASVIALAGNKIIMAENAFFMIHNPSGVVMGTASDMRGFADFLDKIAGTMVTTYTGKTGKSDSDIRAMLDAETWMTAEEAKEAGFVDEIGEEMEAAACAKFVPLMSKAGFKNIPKSIGREKPSVKEAEKALRDVGFSHKEAKAILAEGLRGSQRDVDDPPEPRDVAPAKPAKKSRVEELLTRAELLAPSLAA